MILRAAALALYLFAPLQTPPDAPYSVAPGLFDGAAPELGLRRAPGTETFTVFAPDRTDRFNNGVVLIGFKGRLYAQWQTSPRDEDSRDTRVAWSVSDDGEHWSAPETFVPAGENGRMVSSGGWWTDGETLVAYTNIWPDGFQSGAGGYAEYRLSTMAAPGPRRAGSWAPAAALSKASSNRTPT